MEEKNALEIELAADDLEDHEYVYVASPEISKLILLWI